MNTDSPTVNCIDCGPVEHQRDNGDDQAHCPCWEIYDDEFGAGYRDECECECHERVES